MQEPSRILVRGVNWLGDAVMTTPALQRLRERFPKAHITLLTHEKLAELWAGHAALNEVLPFSARENPWSIARRLRPREFQTALILPNSPRSALECWLAKIPQRIGYARAWRNPLLTQAVPARAGAGRMRKRSISEIKRLARGPAKESSADASGGHHATRHQVHDYLGLAAVLGADPTPVAPRLHLEAEEIVAAQRAFGLASGTAESRWFGLNAGAEYGPAKRWPAERFIAAAVELHRRAHCRWVIFGSPADQPLARQIGDGIDREQPGSGAALNVAGKTSLRQLCALLKGCRVLLTNDTGPMHVAAALGTPVVVPFGSTSPELTGPGLPGESRHRLLKSNAPCAPCFQRLCPIDFPCMKGIAVDRVVEAVLAVAA